MSERFKVDLDELDGVVRQLRRLRADMDEPSQKVKYSTTIPASAFGVDFLEAGKLAKAHDGMQEYMSQVINALQDLTTGSARRRKPAGARTRTRSTRPRRR